MNLLLVAALVIMVLFIGIHVSVYAWIWVDSWLLRRRLHLLDRTLKLNEAKNHLKTDKGIIIVDSPTLGWDVLRIWWSPDGEFSRRPETWGKDRLCPQEDMENYRRFIDPVSGCAKLLHGFVWGPRIDKYLRKHFPLTTPHFVFTGAVLMESALEHKKKR